MTPPSPPRVDATATHALLLQLFLQQEDARQAVGRALHNQVGQALSAIKMTAHLTLDEADPAQRREDLQEIIRTSDETVAVLRDLHALLHPPQLEALGLEAALRAEMERIASPAAPVEVDFSPLPRAPAAIVALVAFRIAQSLARQAAAHAAPPALSLADDHAADVPALALTVASSPAPALQDQALLRALAASVGGTLSEQAAGHGMRWRLRLPYEPTPSMPRPHA